MEGGVFRLRMIQARNLAAWELVARPWYGKDVCTMSEAAPCVGDTFLKARPIELRLPVGSSLVL